MAKIFIAGASGFVGKALTLKLLENSWEVTALTRQAPSFEHPRLRWLQGDLFSLKDITDALSGHEQAIYLVHSMLPSAGLVQGQFYDLDLLLADNFARACRKNSIKHVLYLAGLLPAQKSDLSWHLRSRLEVEECLSTAAGSVSVLRASMVIGSEGSSFMIMRKLVERLPVMVLPEWTKTLAQPIDLNDLLKVMESILTEPDYQGKTWDVAGPEILTYQSMMKKLGALLNKDPIMLDVQSFSLKLSRLWVSVVTGAPKALVYPLVMSLKHPMVASPGSTFPRKDLMSTGFEESVTRWLSKTSQNVHAFQRGGSTAKNVRSVQRMVLPRGKNAQWVAEEYFLWLPHFFSFLIRTQLEGDVCRFYFIHPSLTLLLLEKSIDKSTPDRPLMYVRGGWLARIEGRGRLEFREVLKGRYILAALHDFIPRLPWFIYKYTQAVIHLIVMRSFGEHLKRLSEKGD